MLCGLVNTEFLSDLLWERVYTTWAKIILSLSSTFSCKSFVNLTFVAHVAAW